MSKLIRTFLITLFLFTTVVQITSASTGDIVNVLSHDQELVITDPSQGYKNYSNWTVFPSAETTFRKVMLNITYACPDGLHCGEWDYIDHVFLRRVNEITTDTLAADSAVENFTRIELARMISPYGWRFDSTWSFTWSVDITDFSLLLHDSVQIEFKHTGYENNDDRGWLVTLDFEITEGRPAVEILGMDTLWSGSFPYGDTSRPIETLLYPIEFSHDSAQSVRLRIHQTGHGMDSYENCAEFCKKYRRVYFDSELIDTRELWRKCGDNPLYPQAGTWIFDRANWCPGQVVFPDIIDQPITADSSHTIDIEMQAYLNLKKPSANWSIYSYLFYSRLPWAKNDVSLEEIIKPSSSDQNSRINPVCASPVIKIKNSGSDLLSLVTINYGFEGGSFNEYVWHGDLPSQQSAIITIPGDLLTDKDSAIFVVRLSSPNRAIDEYPRDNKLTATYQVPPALPSEIYVAYHTNNEPKHNAYFITNGSGYVVGGRGQGTMQADSTYLDRYQLEPGCYQLNVSDSSGDGLELWFNPDGGFGSVRILDADRRLLKNFNSDFGSSIGYWFSVTENSPTIVADPTPLVNIFPPRNDGTFKLYLFFNDQTDIRVDITHDSLGTVYERSYFQIKDDALAIDISDQPDGRYKLNVTSNGRTITRRLRIRR